MIMNEVNKWRNVCNLHRHEGSFWFRHGSFCSSYLPLSALDFTLLIHYCVIGRTELDWTWLSCERGSIILLNMVRQQSFRSRSTWEHCIISHNTYLRQSALAHKGPRS